MRKNLVPLLFATTFFILMVLTGCVTKNTEAGESSVQKSFYVPAVGEELFGTWVNPELNPPTYAQKIVFYPWGLIEWYDSADGTVFHGRGTSTIVEKWTDKEGNTWYRDFERWGIGSAYGATAYTLHRVSKDEQTLEFISAGSGWPNPADMDPTQNTTYVKYRRRK